LAQLTILFPGTDRTAPSEAPWATPGSQTPSPKAAPQQAHHQRLRVKQARKIGEP
jgi:hypothetical protein